MRKELAVAVALLIVLGAVAGAVYVGYSREPGREVTPRNDGGSPDPESILVRFLERPSDGLLKPPADAEGEYEPSNAHGFIVSRVLSSTSAPDGFKYQRKRQTARLRGTWTAILGLPVGLSLRSSPSRGVVP